jgi:hypothetical protein
MATLPDGIVCGTPPYRGPDGTPDGGRLELRSGGTDGLRLGGCGLLGGGGGVRALGVPESVGLPNGCPAPEVSAGGAGRERMGGGGGPEGFAKTGEEGDAAGAGTTAGGAAEGDDPVGLTSVFSSGTGMGPGPLGGGGVGVIPGSVLRGACGVPTEAGRGGANDGRGGTAPDALCASGGTPFSGFSSLISSFRPR